MPQDIDQTNDKEFVAGIIIGAIVGAGLALLLGTEEGKDARVKLKRKANELLKELPELARDTEEKVIHLKDKVVEEAQSSLAPGVRNLQERGRKLVHHLLGSSKKSGN